MGAEWHCLPLGKAPLEIVDGDRGKNYPKRSEFTESGHCLFLNTANVTSHGFDFTSPNFISKERDQLLRKGRVQKHDVVLTTRGTVGNVAWWKNDLPFKSMRINSGMVILRADSDRILPRFLYLFMKSKFFRDQVKDLTTGSAQPQLPIRDIRRIICQIPSLREQRRIAAVLGALDDKIELNRQMNETLEATAQAIFQSWFIDFDGVPPGNLVDSELGPIPKGWEVGPIRDFVRFNPPTKLKRGSQTLFVEMKVLSTSDSSVGSINQKVFKGSGSKFVQGDTLLARITPCLENGKTALVNFLSLNEVGFGSTEFIVMRSSGSISSGWVYCLARSKDFRKHAIQNMIGSSGRQRVPVACFDHFMMARPSDQRLTEYRELAEPLFSQIKSNTIESRTLTALRDTLLPKLISGEVRVPEAEAQVEAVG